jgi:ankyrin repeat protein
MINAPDFEVVEALLRAHPAGAGEENHNGNFPLHLAMMSKKVDLKVVEALLRAEPTAAARRNSEGNFPLHIAVRNPTSVEVVEALLRADSTVISQRDNGGNLPLHLALMDMVLVDDDGDGFESIFSYIALKDIIRALLHADPSAAARQNIKGNLPLHLAVMSSRWTVEIVEALLAAYPSATSQKNIDGIIPLDFATKHQASTDVVEALLRAQMASDKNL